MKITRRPYQSDDCQRIGQFLDKHYQPDNRDGNWLQPAWEYAMTHPALDTHGLRRMTIWEDADAIVEPPEILVAGVL